MRRHFYKLTEKRAKEKYFSICMIIFPSFLLEYRYKGLPLHRYFQKKIMINTILHIINLLSVIIVVVVR